MAKAGSVWAALLLPAVFVLAACGQDNRYAAPPPPKVPVAPPVEQKVSEYFESTGNMAAINTVDLVARVQGFVQAISYADGDYVKKGTSLFTIEPEPYRLKVEAAKAAVTSAQATLKQNEAEYTRQADLVQRQVSAVATYDKALALRDSAQADLQSARPTRSRPRSISATPTSPPRSTASCRRGRSRSASWSGRIPPPFCRRSFSSIRST
jgi:multidrug efflux pump subunit AcrA (membrane-fusion protein)